MLLAIDVGNTLTDVGVFDNHKLIRTFLTESVSTKSADEYETILSLFIQSKSIDPREIGAVIISSVVPSLTRVFSLLSEKIFHCSPVILGPRLKSGLLLKVDHPAEVGSDLVADAVGALHKYGPSCVIVDLGTANKVILLDKTGAFSGVAIAPGFKISIDALVEKTAALPEVSLTVPKSVIGKNTEDAMNSGMIYGTGFAVRGLAEAFEKEAGYPLKKILTGGNAPYVKDVLPDFTYDEWILLEGLRDIYVRNQK